MDPNEDVIVRLRELQDTTEKGKPMLTEDQINELISERDALRTEVSELKSANHELTEKDKTSQQTIAELLEEAILSEVREQVVMEDAHELIVENVRLLAPQNRHAVKEAVKKVLDRESIKRILKNQVREQMGPSQPVRQNRNQNQTPQERYLQIPNQNGTRRMVE